MPLFRSAYDTTFGSRYKTDIIQTAVVKATVSNYLNKPSERYTLIEDLSDSVVDVPAFGHPLYVSQNSIEGLYVDARPFISVSRQTGEKKVTSMADYNMLLARAGLEYIWRTDSPQVFRGSSSYPVAVYSSWLSENIVRRFGLEPEDQYRLTIFAAWFWYSLFTEEETPNDVDFAKHCQAISRATKISATNVIEVLQGQDYVKDINDFCSRLYEVVGNIRLRDFTSILLYPILTSTWFGANSNEIVAVSIEHPPSFMAMMMAALSERAYTRSMLSKMMERLPVKNQSNDWLMQMTSLLRS